MKNERIFGSVKRLALAAMLTAMSVVLGKFLQIPNPFQEFIRISFENLPIMLAGISLGPIAGMLVGVCADLIGCVSYGYSINWRITLGAAAIGFISGLISNYIVKKPPILKFTLSVSVAHLIGSVFIKSWGLAVWYLAKYELGFWEFVLWRLINYAIIATLETVIIYLLYKNPAFRQQIEGLTKK